MAGISLPLRRGCRLEAIGACPPERTASSSSFPATPNMAAAAASPAVKVSPNCFPPVGRAQRSPACCSHFGARFLLRAVTAPAFLALDLPALGRMETGEGDGEGDFARGMSVSRGALRRRTSSSPPPFAPLKRKVASSCELPPPGASASASLLLLLTLSPATRGKKRCLGASLEVYACLLRGSA